jgi:immunoglobulin-binding protein 1
MEHGGAEEYIKDAGVRRTMKIQRFKRQKECKNKLSELEAKLNKKSNSNTAKGSKEDDEDQDEMDREFITCTLEVCMMNAVDNLSLIKDETKLLQEFEKRKSESNQQSQGQSQSFKNDPTKYTERLESVSSTSSGALLSKEGRPLRPFMITNSREKVKEGVFRPGHNLPTM